MTDGSGNPSAEILICQPAKTTMAELRHILTDAGYAVHEARSAQRMMQHLARNHPDLILCDTDLPGADGISLIRFIRQSYAKFDDVPIMMLSARGTLSDVAAGKRAGADDYLTLPVDQDTLVATVMAQLRLARRVRRAGPAPDSLSPVPVPAGLLAAHQALAQHFSFGIVLIGGAGQTLFMNDAARQMTGRDTRTIRDWLTRTAGLFLNGANSTFKRPGQRTGDHSILLSPTKYGPLPGTVFVTVMRLSAVEAREPATAVLLYSPHNARDLGVRLVGEAVGLTRSETAVAQLLSQGRRIDEITHDLSISRPTVNFHLHNIFCKTATARQTELVALLHCAQLRG